MFKGRIVYYAVISVVLALVVSGCVSTPPPAGTPTATPVSTTPAVTTPAPGTNVEVLNAPANATVGKSFSISWRVNSPLEKNITHTAVHYGPESKSEPLTLQSYPSLTTPQGGKIPADFSANITTNIPGVIYFRAHAIIDAVNYWSGEKTITVTGTSTTALTATPTVRY